MSCGRSALLGSWRRPGVSRIGDGGEQDVRQQKRLDRVPDRIGWVLVDALQDVDRLGQVCDDHPCSAGPQYRLDFVGCRFVGDQRDERVRVEKRHRLSSAVASSFRAFARRAAEEPIVPLIASRAATIGSSGKGRMTTRSPRSSTATDLVCQRRRTPAGREICPPAVIFRIFIESIVLH